MCVHSSLRSPLGRTGGVTSLTSVLTQGRTKVVRGRGEVAERSRRGHESGGERRSREVERGRGERSRSVRGATDLPTLQTDMLVVHTRRAHLVLGQSFGGDPPKFLIVISCFRPNFLSKFSVQIFCPPKLSYFGFLILVFLTRKLFVCNDLRAAPRKVNNFGEKMRINHECKQGQ